MAPGGYGYYGSQQTAGIQTYYVTSTATYSNYPTSSYYYPRRRPVEQVKRTTAKAPFPVAAKDAAPCIGDVEWQREEPPKAHEHRPRARAVAAVRGRRPMRGRSGRPHGITLS